MKGRKFFTFILFCVFITAQANIKCQADDNFYFGANEHWMKGEHDKIADFLLKDIGFNSYRSYILWYDLEWYAKGRYSFNETHAGINTFDSYIRERNNALPSREAPAPLLLLTYGNPRKFPGNFSYGEIFPPEGKAIDGFKYYASALVTRYKGKIPLVEVWNEWNLGLGSGDRDSDTSNYGPRLGKEVLPCPLDWRHKYCYTPAILSIDKDGIYNNNSATMPEHYLRLLKPTYKEIKKADKNIKVLSGSIAGLDWWWTKRFIESGGLKYTDGYSVHQYFDDSNSGGRLMPEKAVSELDLFYDKFKKLITARNSDNNSTVKEIPLYITETGISVEKPKSIYNGKSGGIQAASDLIKYILLVRTRQFVKGLWVYTLRDSEYGLYDQNYKIRENGIAYYLKALGISKIVTEGTEFNCTVDGRSCSNFGFNSNVASEIVGRRYVISWRDKYGKMHQAQWIAEPLIKNGNLGITIDDKQW
jgi:hypothetical protein